MALNVQNRRKQQRHEFPDVVTICVKGVSHVININSGGISFRCRCKQCLLKKWDVDIVDSKTGIHLQGFPVEKIWESAENKKNYTPILVTTVGVKFKSLSFKQQLAIDELIYK